VTKITFTESVKSIPIGSEFINEGVSVMVSGWGRTQRREPLSELLQYINPQTITNEDCRRRMGPLRHRVFQNSLCTLGGQGVGM
jgi:hypothetical protein